MSKKKLKYYLIQSNYSIKLSTICCELFLSILKRKTSGFILTYIIINLKKLFSFVNFLANFNSKKPFQLRLRIHHMPQRQSHNTRQVCHSTSFKFLGCVVVPGCRHMPHMVKCNDALAALIHHILLISKFFKLSSAKNRDL